MEDIEESDGEGEIVYDVTNIEELDHFDIGEDVPEMEVPAEQIDVMEFMGPNTSVRTTRTRRSSNRIIHMVKEHTLPTSSSNSKMLQRRKPHPGKDSLKIDSEVVMEPTTSASRIFITAQGGLHMDLPLYSENVEKFNTAAQIIASNAVEIDQPLICQSIPQEFTGTGTFIVSLNGLANRTEVGLDGLGPWGSPQGSSKIFKLTPENHVVGALPNDYTWKIFCNRYTHPGTDGRGMFYKKIYTGVNNENVPSPLAVIVYEWIGEPHAIAVNASTIPHAGGIKDVAYGNRSWEARLDDILRDECLSYREHPVFSRICVDFGTACRILLAHAQIQEHRICSQVPREFRECGTFVLNITQCAGERGIYRDGRDWNKPSGSSRFFRVDEQGNYVRADINNTHPEERYDIQIMLKRYETLDPPGLIRKIFVARDKAKRLASPIAVVTYLYRVPGVHKSNICTGRPVQTTNKKRLYPLEEDNSGKYDSADEETMYKLRRKTLEMQADNQNRFGLLLDRAESFLDRFEQAGSRILVPLTQQIAQVWRMETPPQRPSSARSDLNSGPPFLAHFNEH